MSCGVKPDHWDWKRLYFMALDALQTIRDDEGANVETTVFAQNVVRALIRKTPTGHDEAGK